MTTMNVKLAAGIIGGSALVGMVGVYVGVTAASSEVNTANTSIVSFTPPPSTPTVSVAVPGITGKAPLFAGEAPNSNPQG